MGFFPDILWVIEKMPNRSQNLLFSATFPEEVLNVAEEFMRNAEHVMSDDLEVDIPEIDLYAGESVSARSRIQDCIQGG